MLARDLRRLSEASHQMVARYLGVSLMYQPDGGSVLIGTVDWNAAQV
jgi:hypothetical protein